jgi:hypothetical protein
VIVTNQRAAAQSPVGQYTRMPAEISDKLSMHASGPLFVLYVRIGNWAEKLAGKSFLNFDHPIVKLDSPLAFF